MKASCEILILLITLVTGVGSSIALAEEPKQSSNQWLLDAENDTDRFKRLEIYLRGFDQPMWEVGYRFEIVYDAIIDENYELATYHWGKVKLTIENGYLKRPARKTNADLIIFQSGIWKSLDTALKEGDSKKIKSAFSDARLSCMGCHAAESVPFMNEQKIFRRTGTFPEPGGH